MAGPGNLIKQQIMVNLNALVTAGTLGSVLERDINVNPLDDPTFAPSYPCAILGTSSMQSVWEYQQNNKRTYRFDILVIQQSANLTTMGDMEDLRDAIATQFDNNVTLNGQAQLGVAAIMSERMTLGQKGKNFEMFYVTLRATTLVPLTYTF
jgi:hypothetical protein